MIASGYHWTVTRTTTTGGTTTTVMTIRAYRIPSCKFYRSNGQPLVMNGDAVEDTLGSGTATIQSPEIAVNARC